MRNTAAAKVMQKDNDDKSSGTHRVAKKETTRNVAMSMADALADILEYETKRATRMESRI